MLVAGLNSSLFWLAATGVLAFFLTGFFTWFARREGMLDIPNERHSHTIPTPRGGGAGLIAALFIVSFSLNPDSVAKEFWLRCALPGIAAVSLVGWWDDRGGLSAGLRFVIQLLATCYLFWYLGSTGLIPNLVLALAGFGFMLWMTNLYNFMDGSNGMAGFQGVFTGCALAWLFVRAGDDGAAAVSALIAAACLGFLPWNLGRARVFMGDVASGSLGFAFAALLVYGVFTGRLSPPVAWMVVLVFLCDTSLTLLERVIRGERWYNPHKQHLYQRLISCGWSHGGVLALYQSINLVVVAPAIAVAVSCPAWASLVATTTTMALVLGWLLVKKHLECSL